MVDSPEPKKFTVGQNTASGNPVNACKSSSTRRILLNLLGVFVLFICALAIWFFTSLANYGSADALKKSLLDALHVIRLFPLGLFALFGVNLDKNGQLLANIGWIPYLLIGISSIFLTRKTPYCILLVVLAVLLVTNIEGCRSMVMN